MATVITSGTGNRSDAGVTDNNELKTTALTKDILTNLGLTGYAWTISSGAINLTSGSASAIAYIKNTDTVGLLLRDFVLSSSRSNDTTTPNTNQTAVLTVGTPVVSEDLTATITPLPLRASLEKDLSATLESGAEGKSATTGISIITRYFQCGTDLDLAGGEGYFFLEPNDTVAVTVTPPSGNTNLNLSLTATLYKNDGTL